MFLPRVLSFSCFGETDLWWYLSFKWSSEFLEFRSEFLLSSGIPLEFRGEFLMSIDIVIDLSHLCQPLLSSIIYNINHNIMSWCCIWLSYYRYDCYISAIYGVVSNDLFIVCNEVMITLSYIYIDIINHIVISSSINDEIWYNLFLWKRVILHHRNFL